MPEYLVIDEAWSKTPATALGAYHGAFVYISRDASKCASDVYIAAVHAAGKGVGFVFEDANTRWRGGSVAGGADGVFANAWADAHGVPATLPLYAAVDQDVVTVSDMALAVAYITAFGAVKRQGRGYGEYDLIERLAAIGVSHGWQTCAWSGGRVSSHAAIYQRLGHTAPTVPGSYDEDVVLDLADAGLWFTTTPVPPTPAPLPVPVTSEDPDMRSVIFTVANGQLALSDGLTKHLLNSTADATIAAELGNVLPSYFDPKTYAVTAKWVPATYWDSLVNV